VGENPGPQAQQRGFSRAIGAEQADDLTGAHFKIHAGHRSDRGEFFP